MNYQKSFLKIIQLKKPLSLKHKLLQRFVQLFHPLRKGWGADKILSADSSRLQHCPFWPCIFWIHTDPCPTPAGARSEDNSALPSSQCGPAALGRRPLVASGLPPSLAAPQPGKDNKTAAAEEEINNEQCSTRKAHEIKTKRD